MPTNTTNLQAEMLHLARQQGKTAFLQANNADTGFVLTINGEATTVSPAEITAIGGNPASGRTLMRTKLTARGVRSPY